MEKDPGTPANNGATFTDDFDSACSTPFVSDPSSPGHGPPTSYGGGYFYSAPASPIHFMLSSSSSYMDSSNSGSSTPLEGCGGAFEANPDTSHHGTQSEIDAIVESVIYNDINEMLEVMALTINKVSCEISCKCIGGGDAHATTTGIFNMLSHYGWDVKAIITLAAFMVNYGEFWLVVQLCTSNPLAKSLAHLKQMHDVLERDEKKQIEAYLLILRVMETPHLDNTKPLKHLIYLKDDQLPLYESSTKNRVSIDILKKKIVLLLVSDLDLAPDELTVLDQMYREARQNPTRPES
ncbi:hypothetical protein L1987_57844 [Smallanthus sonchifolius]|uniref:Uncharacterized protein n=1 Tax=Smallanthus sonchifolius TaxID=185202 RepID=A0ACB9DEF0_9ASTR|nr:hypothetical protein L1987_57844 [Smallanthus sonchifolius]